MQRASGFGGHSMVSQLSRVAICSPHASGWSDLYRVEPWQRLNYEHEPRLEIAQSQHDQLRRELEGFGAEVLMLGDDECFSLDGIYVHDPSFISDYGAICLRMGKDSRGLEPRQHRAFYESIGIPILGEIEPPGTAEAGDMVWLDRSTLLVGRGYRTNEVGIGQLRALLGPRGVDIIAAPLPHGAGPTFCLHLMSLMSLLDEQTVLVDQSWLSVQTIELLHEGNFTLIEIDPSERATLASNVLALGGGTLLAFEENPKTILRLRQAGFEVKTIPGSEIGINGGAGPTCLCRPLLRSQ